ncbi:hypothetical protein M433DRAFT_3956 [Acidomyces richmondensis BFW]|nr:hypothetical protein M433DRAFT_3956 [Acidomyces richmondensis BFW]
MQDRPTPETRRQPTGRDVICGDDEAGERVSVRTAAGIDRSPSRRRPSHADTPQHCTYATTLTSRRWETGERQWETGERHCETGERHCETTGDGSKREETRRAETGREEPRGYSARHDHGAARDGTGDGRRATGDGRWAMGDDDGNRGGTATAGSVLHAARALLAQLDGSTHKLLERERMCVVGGAGEGGGRGGFPGKTGSGHTALPGRGDEQITGGTRATVEALE